MKSHVASVAAVVLLLANVSRAVPIVGGFAHLYGVGPENIAYSNSYGDSSDEGAYALGLVGYGFYGPEIVSVGPGYVEYGASGMDAFAAVRDHGHPGVFLAAAASTRHETKIPRDNIKAGAVKPVSA